MQASLPDLNTQFIKDKNKAISACDSKNWDVAIGAVYSINALLPEDHQIAISTLKYNEENMTTLFGKCPSCTELIENFEQIERLNVVLSRTERIILGKSSDVVWVCPKCKSENSLEQTSTAIQTKQEPYYHKAIPRPPEFKHGFAGRTKYDQDMTKWVWNALNELDHAMMEYRRSYKGKDEQFEGNLDKLLDETEAEDIE